MSSRVPRVLGISILLGTLSACSFQPVQPWEHDLLAQKKMQLQPSAVDAALDEHTYFSKEASRGGAGAGGGGCGCN
ncbi:MAG: DUF4266 domain-containing protein [Gammaproteobacteria bacterium]|nr:DUF4266 domain-containing protein [Gammaproteobacteria bacterium]